MFIANLSGSRLLAHHHHRILTKTPLRHYGTALSHGDPMVIVWRNQSNYVLQHVIDGADKRMGQPLAKGGAISWVAVSSMGQCQLSQGH